jgi:hypothetical protein
MPRWQRLQEGTVTSHEFDLATALVEVETPVWIGWIMQQKDKVKNQRILVVGSRANAQLHSHPVRKFGWLGWFGSIARSA